MANDYPNADFWCKSKDNFIITTFIWPIDNFSLCPQKNGDYLESSTFSAEEDPQTKWYIRLYPKGYNEENKEWVSLYLHFKELSSEKVITNFKLSIFNNWKVREITHLFERNSGFTGYGYSKFISRSSLEGPNNPFLPNDRLSIYCCVTTFTENSLSDRKVEMKTKIETIKDVMTSLYQNRNHCDVDIVVKGHKFSGHKDILSVRSPVFAAMFEHQMKENLQNQVIIDDIDEEVFERMLRFIYTDEVVDKDIDSNVNLLIAANKYNLENLKAICEHKIGSQLTVENVLDILVVAETHSAEELKNSAVVFIGKHLEELKIK